LRESISSYGAAVVMVADQPAIANYQAMGYLLGRAKSKAILK
jgi:hypothetical protein